MSKTLVCAALVAIGGSLASAQSPAADGYTGAVRSRWNSIKRNVAASAAAMPEANYSFKPTPDVRSFGELIGHLTNEHYILCSAMKGDRTVKSLDAFGRFSSSMRMGGLVLAVHSTHQQADLLAVQFRRRIDPGQPAVMNHSDMGRDLEDLVEVLADDQHSGPCLGEIDQCLADAAGRARIDTPGRLVDDHHPRLPVELAADDELLQVAA